MITSHHNHNDHLRCNDHLKHDSKVFFVFDQFPWIYLMFWTSATGHASNETHKYVIRVFSAHWCIVHTSYTCNYYYLNSSPVRNYGLLIWYVLFLCIISFVVPMSFSVVSFTCRTYVQCVPFFPLKPNIISEKLKI